VLVSVAYTQRNFFTTRRSHFTSGKIEEEQATQSIKREHTIYLYDDNVLMLLYVQMLIFFSSLCSSF
jgi:hypothetical protein